jgi:hypothetical protein
VAATAAGARICTVGLFAFVQLEGANPARIVNTAVKIFVHIRQSNQQVAGRF